MDTWSFKYDPFGRRIYKSSSTTTSIYAYDGDNLIEETNSSGTAVARYSQTQNIDEPLAILRAGATSYYHADGLGSVTSLSNSAGSLAQTYTYDSFGNQKGSTGSLVNPFRYTARESDAETGLYYYRARYYDTSVGRFLSEDPIWAGDDSKWNFYPYASSDPVNRFDPTGLSDLLYLRDTQTLVLLDGNGILVGVYPAGNSTCQKCKNSSPPYNPGTYAAGPYHPHPESADPNGPFGLRGIFLFPSPGCKGCGVHAGRRGRSTKAGQSGPQFPKLGCIRTTDEAIKKILDLTNGGDPLKRLYVR